MSFLDQVAADNANVFLNCGEFAELHTVKYDGVTYDGEDHTGIPVVLTRLQQSKTPVPVTSHWDGLRSVKYKVHVALADIGGILPNEGEWISISDGIAVGETYYRRYLIVTSGEAMGMVTLELEANED